MDDMAKPPSSIVERKTRQFMYGAGESQAPSAELEKIAKTLDRKIKIRDYEGTTSLRTRCGFYVSEQTAYSWPVWA